MRNYMGLLMRHRRTTINRVHALNPQVRWSAKKKKIINKGQHYNIGGSLESFSEQSSQLKGWQLGSQIWLYAQGGKPSREKTKLLAA
jgi:hypothetical protein